MRWGEVEAKWRTYGLTRVHYGDRPAAAVLEVAKELAAALGQDDYPVAAKKSTEASYVDDSVTGGTDEELSELVGTQSKNNDGSFNYSGTLSQIYSRVGMKIKTIVHSGEQDQEVIKMAGGKFLGHNWEPREDLITFEMNINLHKKSGGLKGGPDLTIEDLADPVNVNLTQRKVLRLVAQFYDPQGLISPLIIRLKILLKESLDLQDLQWDTPLPPDIKDKWIKMLKEFVQMKNVVFLRSARPQSAVGRPWLVGFWDGANPAYCCVVYLRWALEDNSVEVRLLTAKARVVGKTCKTTPRSELNGLLVLARLVSAAVEGMVEKPEKIILGGDSQCTIAAVNSNTSTLAPYFRNRVSEIVDDHVAKWASGDDNIEVENLQYVPGPENPADLGTWGEATQSDVTLGSRWQCGPEWLKWDCSDWIMTEQHDLKSVPDVERSIKEVFSVKACETPRTRLENVLYYSNSIDKVRGIMARILRASSQTDRLSVSLPLGVNDYKKADYVIRKISMVSTHSEIKAGNMVTLAPFIINGLYYTRGRLRQGLQQLLGVSELLLLTYDSRLAYLTMKSCHDRDHKGVLDTLWKSRSTVWIVKGHLLAKRIVKACLYCKVKAKSLESQQMADLPPQCVVVSRPWTNVCLDLSGPIKVRSMVNSRAHMKCWPLIITCLNTAAVWMFPMHNYGTSAFLLSWHTFTSLRGVPSFVYSDQGSQLTSGAKYVTWT